MSILHKAAIEHLLYPAMEYTKGNRIRAKTAVLRQSEAAPGLPDRQCAALQSLLLDCIRHVPAYRRLHLPAYEILADPRGVLARSVPVLHKAQFRDHAADYLSDAFSPAERIPNCTGGSTGQPVHFFMTRDQVESYEAARWRGLSWYGITPGSRSVMGWGNPVELDANQQRRQRWREQLLKNAASCPPMACGQRTRRSTSAFSTATSRNTCTATPPRWTRLRTSLHRIRTNCVCG